MFFSESRNIEIIEENFNNNFFIVEDSKTYAHADA